MELHTKSPVYIAELPKESEDGNLILFGAAVSEAEYDDGSNPESHFSVSRFLWEKAGSPEKIIVAFSADEFTAIPTATYLEILEEAENG